MDSQNQKELIRIGAFHPDDLEFNRAGDLSTGQKEKLLFFVIYWLAIAGLDFGIIVLLIHAQLLMYAETATPAILGSIFLGIMSIMCIKNCIPFWKDFKEGKVKTVSGMVAKHFAIIGTGTGKGFRGYAGYCNIKVQDQVFSLNPGHYDLVVDHDNYQLFYAPNSKRIVNIEPL